MNCKKCGNALYCLECEGELVSEVLNDEYMEKHPEPSLLTGSEVKHE